MNTTIDQVSADTFSGLPKQGFSTKDIIVFLYKKYNDIDLPDDDPLVQYGSLLDAQTEQLHEQLEDVSSRAIDENNEAIRMNLRKLEEKKNRGNMGQIETLEKQFDPIKADTNQVKESELSIRRQYVTLLEAEKAKIPDLFKRYTAFIQSKIENYISRHRSKEEIMQLLEPYRTQIDGFIEEFRTYKQNIASIDGQLEAFEKTSSIRKREQEAFFNTIVLVGKQLEIEMPQDQIPSQRHT